MRDPESMPEAVFTEVRLDLHVTGEEKPHTLVKARMAIPDGKGEYYRGLAEVLEQTAKRLRKDAEEPDAEERN